MALQLFCFILLFLSSFVCCYYWILVVGFCFNRKKKGNGNYGKNSKEFSYAIVIPAHNEEDVITATLSSCNNLDYPSEKFEVIVVADNCTDKTAEIARQCHSTVLERFDEKNRGKGFALEWAFKRILKENYDAIIVVDADCLLDKIALQEISGCLNQGNSVIQVNYCVENPDDSPMTYALAVGNYIENELFYLPKSNLGLAVIVRGTGMVFTKDVLRNHPWGAHSIVEDLEYSLSLIKRGVKIKFLETVKVVSPFPTTIEQLRVQRTRWASGNLSFGKKEALKLIWQGLTNRNVALTDAGLAFLALSKPLVLMALFLTVFFALLCVLYIPGKCSTFLLTSSFVVAGFYFSYFIVGIYRFGLSLRRLSLLFQTPVVIAHLMLVSLVGILGVKKDLWVRTPRS